MFFPSFISLLPLLAVRIVRLFAAAPAISYPLWEEGGSPLRWKDFLLLLDSSPLPSSSSLRAPPVKGSLLSFLFLIRVLSSLDPPPI